MGSNAKIFIIYHTPKEAIYTDIYRPICVGEFKDQFDEFFLRDDVGKNIAYKNNKYNELTAIYWVYKHINEFWNDEYIGFFHYRRFLCFNGLDQTAYVQRYINHELIDIGNDRINEIFKEYDFISPRPSHYKSVRKHYERSHNRVDIDIILELIDKKYPEYSDDAREYFNNPNDYLYNMFVFKKKDFMEYSKFLFSLVDEFCKYKNDSLRLFISERITGIFIYHLIKQGYKPYHLPVLYVRRKLVWPAFKQVVYNFRNKRSGNRSLFMKMKPLILCFMPRHIEQYFRRRKVR